MDGSLSNYGALAPHLSGALEIDLYEQKIGGR